MRAVIIFLLLIIFGFIAWRAFEQFKPQESDDTVTVVGEETAPAEAEPVQEEPALPSFDVVRVDRTGYAVIGGRAIPGSTVTVYAGEEALISETTDPDGSWVVTTDTPLESGSVELSLSMTTPDGLTVKSEQTIVIYVPEREGERPLVLRTTPGGATQVLQEPHESDGSLGPLTLDAIDYDDSGSVIFSGRAEPQRTVQVFANRNFVNQTRSNSDGYWTMSASMAPGVYTLHIVQLDEEGRPAYAIELPFERASASEIELRDGKVIVQPGNSLWRIARRAYGSGFQYTVIYEANEDQIRDPDLIYPGQIFTVPEESESEENSQ